MAIIAGLDLNTITTTFGGKANRARTEKLNRRRVANRSANYLCHNNGDGTFTKVKTFAGAAGNGSWNGSWGDYDRDGWLDLFISKGNGNSNHWLKVRCAGTASNRSGIGAKVRVKTAIQGQERWQWREISGGTGFGQSSLLAHFGLGGASQVEILRIEWPSGAVQDLRQIDADQTLTVIEPPALTGAHRVGEAFAVNVIGLMGESYVVEISEDLTNWILLVVLTNASRNTVFTDPLNAQSAQRFYRSRTR
jgi:hypothetical protein